MKTVLYTSALILSFAAPAFAEGDVSAGEKTFKKCKSCHMIAPAEGDPIVKGGKTGPNLYGVIGRAAGAQESYKYGKSLAAAGEAGLVWSEENLAEYSKDPKAFLQAELDDSKAKSKMTYKLRKGSEDVAAYLASLAPAPEEEATDS